MPSATLTPPSTTEAWRWWEARRLRYNLGLAAAGWAAWGLLALEGVWLAPMLGQNPFYPSLAVTLGQGLAYLVVMAVANLCYLLGPVSETVFKPDDREGYRHRMYVLGFGFSVALPFLAPAAVFVAILGGSRV